MFIFKNYKSWEFTSPTSRVKHTNVNYTGPKWLGFEVKRCLLGDSYEGWRTCACELHKIGWCNCRVTLKSPCSGNVILATPVGLSVKLLKKLLRNVMPRGVTSELLVEEENDDLEDRFDNSSFDDIFSFRFFKNF